MQQQNQISIDYLQSVGFVQKGQSWQLILPIANVLEIRYFPNENQFRYQSVRGGFTNILSIARPKELEQFYYFVTGSELMTNGTKVMYKFNAVGLGGSIFVIALSELHAKELAINEINEYDYFDKLENLELKNKVVLSSLCNQKIGVWEYCIPNYPTNG